MNSAVPVGRFVDIGDGLRIHTHEAGEGPAVIFVHGSGPGASGWSNFHGNYPALAARGFRVVVPDLLGFGLSSKPEEASYSLSFLCDGLLRLADALGLERFALVGNSLGGAACIQVAVDQPELVSRLVLMAPGGLETRETYMEMAGIRGMMKTVFARGGYTAENIRALFGLQLYDPALITDALVQQRLEVALTQPRRVFETLAVPHLTPELGRVRCPTLALWGREDQFCPVSGATTLLHGVSDVEVITLGRCGHWVMVERPDVFDRECARFLAGV